MPASERRSATKSRTLVSGSSGGGRHLHEGVAEARPDDFDGVDDAVENCFTMNSATTFTSLKPRGR
jgi:hypothetical protein